jgi:putative nucleotidyltransferase with HDIG domain
MASWDWLFIPAVTVLLLALEPDRDFHAFVEAGYLLYGIPIIYTSLLFGKRYGLLVAIFTQLCNMLIMRNEFAKEWAQGKYGELFLEGIMIPFLYFISCILLSQVILRERKLLVMYRDLAEKLAERNDILQKIHLGIIKTLTRTIDAKDSYTRGHSERVACYALAAARAIGMSPREQRNVFYAGALHDIGKIGISEQVLFKAGSLSTEEYREMQGHPLIGANIVSGLDYLEEVETLIKAHHERFDGTGYPYGLKEQEIPLGSRIINVVDSYDAIVTNRCYNEKKLIKSDGIEELKRCAGTQFDPEIVKLFIEQLESNIELDFNRCLNMLLE